jgi:hypothetical protein
MKHKALHLQPGLTGHERAAVEVVPDFRAGRVGSATKTPSNKPQRAQLTTTLDALESTYARQVPEWRAVAVFGDKLAAAAVVSPSGLVGMFDFPERVQVDKPVRIRREVVIDLVVEHVVKTGNVKQPQFTLFMRPPIGMTDMSEADGVLAVCLLANSVEEVKRRPSTRNGWL